MTAVAWPLQQAVYTRLSSDADLAALAGVYDEPPEDVPHPYVTVGESTETPMDAHDRRGVDITITLHIWSRYRGFRQALDILAALDRLMDQRGGAAALPVTGFTRVFCSRESYQTVRDPEPDVRHVTAIYRITAAEE